MWRDQSFRWTLKMILCWAHDHAPIQIDRLTAINVIVTSAKIEVQHSPQNLKMTTFTKNVRRPIVPMDINDDFMQSARSRSDQNWSTYGYKCESHIPSAGTMYSPVQKLRIDTVHKIWRWRPSQRMWGDQSYRWTLTMISCRVHDHAPIKIDRLTAINVKVISQAPAPCTLMNYANASGKRPWFRHVIRTSITLP